MIETIYRLTTFVYNGAVLESSKLQQTEKVFINITNDYFLNTGQKSGKKGLNKRGNANKENEKLTYFFTIKKLTLSLIKRHVHHETCPSWSHWCVFLQCRQGTCYYSTT